MSEADVRKQVEKDIRHEKKVNGMERADADFMYGAYADLVKEIYEGADFDPTGAEDAKSVPAPGETKRGDGSASTTTGGTASAGTPPPISYTTTAGAGEKPATAVVANGISKASKEKKKRVEPGASSPVVHTHTHHTIVTDPGVIAELKTHVDPIVQQLNAVTAFVNARKAEFNPTDLEASLGPLCRSLHHFLTASNCEGHKPKVLASNPKTERGFGGSMLGTHKKEPRSFSSSSSSSSTYSESQTQAEIKTLESQVKSSLAGTAASGGGGGGSITGNSLWDDAINNIKLTLPPKLANGAKYEYKLTGLLGAAQASALVKNPGYQAMFK